MPKRPMRMEDLFELKAVGRCAISPDGQRVAFELKRFDLAENKNFMQIMLADVASGNVRALTSGKHVDARPAWSPDGATIGFLSDRDKVNCLWIMPMTGGEPRRLTDREGRVHDFSWSPDGRKIAYTWQPLNEREKLERDDKRDDLKKRPAFKHIKRLRHKNDGIGPWNGHYTRTWIVDVASARTKQLSHGDHDDLEPRFSPDGRWVSFISNRVPNADMNLENSDIYIVKPNGSAARKLTHMQGGCLGHSWSPDGKTIAYIGNPSKSGDWWKHLEHVWLVDARGGKPRELTREIDNPTLNITLGDVAGTAFDYTAPIWSADGSRLFFLVSEHGACRLYSRSIARADLRCEVGGMINIFSAHRSGPDGPIALSFGTQTNPADVFLFTENPHAPAGPRPSQNGRHDLPHVRPPVAASHRRNSTNGKFTADVHTGLDEVETRGALRRLTDVNGDFFRRVEVVQPEPFSVRSGNATVEGWLMKPPRFDSRRKYPAILEIHGGPQGQYGCSFFHEMQWMAAKGYLVCFSNPRGSAGYGLKFMNAIHADWGNLDYQDVMKVADWLFARPFVDKKRVGVTGGSYGGYMTNFLVGHTQRFRAAVTQRSVVNLESMFGTSDFGFHLGYEFGGNPWKALESYRRQSPLTYVEKIRTPLLIEHEEEDHRCPIEQAWQLFSSLKVLGREVELVQFEGESHGLSRGGRPQNRAERLRRIVDWFDRYMT